MTLDELLGQQPETELPVNEPAQQPAPMTSDGIPFLANPGPLTAEDLHRVEYRGTVHVEKFDMTKPEDVEAYTAVRQRLANKKAIQLCEVLKHRKKDDSGWEFLVEWAELFAILKPRR